MLNTTITTMFGIYLILFLFATSLNILVLYLIKLGYFGRKLQSQNWPKLLNDNIYLISIVTFFVVTLTNYLLTSQVIFLDSDLVVKTKIDNANIEVIWDSASAATALKNLGTSGVFVTSIKIATSVLSKSHIHPLPKLALIGATGGAFTVIYQSTLNRPSNLQLNNESNLKVIVHNADLTTDLTSKASNTGENITNYLSNIFNLSNYGTIKIDPQLIQRSNLYQGLEPTENQGVINTLDVDHPSWRQSFKIEERLDPETHNQLIKYLNQTNPSWKDKLVESPQDTSVIQSPLETNAHFQTVLNILDDHLFLNCVILYLLVMLLVIITVKLVLVQKEIKFNNLRKLPLGSFIARLLEKYISIWQTSSNLWIYFIFFSLICFTLFLIYSTNDLIRILKFLIS